MINCAWLILGSSISFIIGFYFGYHDQDHEMKVGDLEDEILELKIEIININKNL